MTKRATPLAKPKARRPILPLIDLAYERAKDPLAPRGTFFRRLTANLGLALGLVAVSLSVGVLGYWLLGGLAVVDAFMNAAMILSGMGPVDILTNDAAKIFAGIYALYSGLTLVATAGLILAPILHRFMHKFHLEDASDQG
jgi:hypothetical protein